MAEAKPLRTVLTIIMDVLVIIAIAEVVRLIVLFFGQLYGTEWGKIVVDVDGPGHHLVRSRGDQDAVRRRLRCGHRTDRRRHARIGVPAQPSAFQGIE